jgi:hypothetical protein
MVDALHRVDSSTERFRRKPTPAKRREDGEPETAEGTGRSGDRAASDEPVQSQKVLRTTVIDVVG